MEKRYTALRFIATIYKILGVIVAILAVLAIIGIIAAFFARGVAFDYFPRQMGGRFMAGPIMQTAVGTTVAAVLALIYGGIVAFMLYGFGEAIYLLIALEENTRFTARILQSQLERE
jgi:ABC-type Fe3+ transport system permease subunit